MGLQINSIANAVGSAVQNVQFQPEAQNVPRKILIIGTQLSTKALTPEVPIQILSPEDCGDQAGFGSMLHRLSVQTFQGGNGIETWIQPQDEAGGAVAADGEVTWVVPGTTEAGTIYLYISGISVPVTIAAGLDLEGVSDAVVAVVNAIKELPLTAATTAVTFETTFESKSKGPWGNDISITFNLGVGESLPTGITSATVSQAMANGAGVPTMADALNGLGVDDDANENFFTDVVHGYGQDTTTLDAISAYVGEGNTFTGLYDKLVSRPFRVLTGDVASGTGGLTALIAITDTRKLDRANGIIAVPDSPSHPSEIAALAIGNMAQINQDRAAQAYGDILLTGIWPGDKEDRWTSDYDNRDTAVKSGISPTRVKSGNVVMQNVVTFYRPDSVPVASNGYRSFRNISILQNILDNIRTNFEQEKWQGISIVGDTTNVSSTIDRAKARDTDSVIDDLMALARAFESKAWLYEAAFTIDALKEVGAVTVRSGSTGFDSTLKVILSGEGGILDTVTQFDISTAVLTQ